MSDDARARDDVGGRTSAELDAARLVRSGQFSILKGNSRHGKGASTILDERTVLNRQRRRITNDVAYGSIASFWSPAINFRSTPRTGHDANSKDYSEPCPRG